MKIGEELSPPKNSSCTCNLCFYFFCFVQDLQQPHLRHPTVAELLLFFLCYLCLIIDQPFEPSVVGSPGYCDPLYWKTHTLTKESDIYSFGVILFEILCGRSAYLEDSTDYPQFLDVFVKHHFKAEPVYDIVFEGIKEQIVRKSLVTFQSIAFQCLHEKREERPTAGEVVVQLHKALEMQNLDHLKIALKDIQLATNNFDEKYCIGFGGYGKVYKCSLEIEMKSEDELSKMPKIVAIKRIISRDDSKGKEGFLVELDVLSRCEHPNIVSLLGFCDKDNEMLLVYEYASNGSLDDYLGSTDKIFNLTWAQRLKMCLDIAHGLNYLHTNTDERRRIIHRDMKSANILLGKNLEAKIADFGLSKFHPENQQASTINTNIIAGTNFYLDPEYAKTGRLKKASDIYSFGVVLFEIFSGKLAYNSDYLWENGNGLAPIARKHFEKGTLKEIMDQKIMDEAHELSSTLKVEPDHQSLNAFSTIAYQCLATTQAERPTIDEVLMKLKESLKFQEKRKDTFKFSLEDIKLGVSNFSDDNFIIGGGHAMLYRGEIKSINGQKKVIIKRFLTSFQEHGFVREFEVLYKHKQENIIGFVGYCKEQDEKIIIYEHASNGFLSTHLNNTSVSWSSRLKICIDLANGLNFLHGADVGQDVVIHRDIKSSNILLTDDWKAKICGFELSIRYAANQKMENGTKESDIYSFGVILFEILCGRSAHLEDSTDYPQFFDVFVKHHFKAEPVYDIVFEGIKEQIVRESLVTFQSVAFQCLHENREERPTAVEVVVQLHKALELQEAYEIWEAKLPINYKDILQYSKSLEIYSTMGKKDIHNILSKGILLKDEKLWFSIGDNGERNEMIPAKMFSFKSRWLRKWRSIQESRFRKVAEMLDISNLNIQIKITPQLLPSNVEYSVHLVFKFPGSRKSDAKRMYVNLKYKMGGENLHAYFARWREDKWMMIELYRFSNNKKETNFEVLLEGFSRCYCDSRTVYIEGVEFRAIDNVKQETLGKLKDVQQVFKSPKHVYHMESAKEVVYDSSNVTLLNSISSTEFRDEWVYKVPQQAKLCIKWYTTEYQMMPPNTKIACYLVFKLSENCRGLHCPVIVRDQFHWKSKEIVYFRLPSPWNLHDTDYVPDSRRDGWMEVIVSKFNSDFVLKKGCLLGRLKLVTYEGTMSGLIIRGLEFRQILEE